MKSHAQKRINLGTNAVENDSLITPASFGSSSLLPQNQVGRQNSVDRLQLLFAELNIQLFGSRLPEYQICRGKLSAGQIVRLPGGKYIKVPWHGPDFYGLCVAERRVILVHCDASSDARQMREILGHEMCHAATYQAAPKPRYANSHGREFIG